MKNLKFYQKGSQGFTLVELMVGVALTGIVLAAVITFYQRQNKSYIVQEEVAVMQQNLRAAANLMARELRMATYGPINNDGAITTAQPALLEFQFENDNAGNMQTIQYSLYDAYGDGDTDIGRRVGLALNPLAENIDALEFVYLDDVGAPTAVLDDIATIQVSMLARSARPEPDFLNTFDYFPASCPQPAPPAAADDSCIVAGSAWDFDGPGNNSNAFNDNFRRRLLTVTIQLRN